MHISTGRPIRLLAAAGLAAGTLLLTGCGPNNGNGNGSETNQNNPGPPPPSGVTIIQSPTPNHSQSPAQNGPAQGGS